MEAIGIGKQLSGSLNLPVGQPACENRRVRGMRLPFRLRLTIKPSIGLLIVLWLLAVIWAMPVR